MAPTPTSYGVHGQEVSVPLKLVTFNILAPCYKRLKDVESSAIKTTDGSIPASGTLPTRSYESSREDLYLERNHRIIQQLVSTNADIICLQEFWTGSTSLVSLYVDQLCHRHGYSMKVLERTSHWRSRKDGLAIFVKNENLYVEDVQEILFHDCGDRVALMLLLSILPSKVKQHVPFITAEKEDIEKTLAPQRLICVNTHLLFPRNADSTKIRLREITKILGYVDTYQKREFLGGQRLPVVITGDFNGSPRGKVYQLLKNQRYCSAWEETCQRLQESQQLQATGSTKDALSTASPCWISHRNHLKTDVFVDHIFFLNPPRNEDHTSQASSSSPFSSLATSKASSSLPADWTNLVFQEVMEKIKSKFTGRTWRDVFNSFDQDRSNYITKEEFRTALEQLGFFGENAPALTPEEVEVLLKSADTNDDGLIDYKEFYDRFWIADEELQRNESSSDRQHYDDENVVLLTTERVRTEEGSKTDLSSGIALNRASLMEEMINSQRFAYARSNFLSQSSTATSSLTKITQKNHKLTNAVPVKELKVTELQMFPKCLEEGCWPDDYELSDHGLLECSFSAQVDIAY